MFSQLTIFRWIYNLFKKKKRDERKSKEAEGDCLIERASVETGDV